VRYEGSRGFNSSVIVSLRLIKIMQEVPMAAHLDVKEGGNSRQGAENVRCNVGFPAPQPGAFSYRFGQF
jgi:hypothetical protein